MKKYALKSPVFELKNDILVVKIICIFHQDTKYFVMGYHCYGFFAFTFQVEMSMFAVFFVLYLALRSCEMFTMFNMTQTNHNNLVDSNMQPVSGAQLNHIL